VTRDLASIWTYFADTSCGTYSPLYDRICRAVAADPDVLALIMEAPLAGHQPNVLLGAVHYLLLSGLEHPLAAVYAGTSNDDAGELFVDLCLRERERVLELLATRHTNTNEVGRSAVLGPAFTYVAAQFGAPLGLVDVGCSAGLNLLCDQYLLDYGDAGTTGPDDAAVRIECAVAGGDPPIAPRLPPVAARVGIRWLLACVWPDTGRLPRTRLALDQARRTPPRFVRGDAVATAGDVVTGLPSEAFAVVMTTWALAYLSRDDRLVFRDRLAEASQHRPIAWISGEGKGVVDAFRGIDVPSDDQGMMASILGLMVFRDGDFDARLLAFVHPHGSWIDWRL
jgi:hypothetical protein